MYVLIIYYRNLNEFSCIVTQRRGNRECRVKRRSCCKNSNHAINRTGHMELKGEKRRLPIMGLPTILPTPLPSACMTSQELVL